MFPNLDQCNTLDFEILELKHQGTTVTLETSEIEQVDILRFSEGLRV